MHGKIMMESETGKGTSFTFTFRAEIGTQVSDIADAAEAKNAPGGGIGAADNIDLHGKRILLAEDVEINREIVITVLQPMGLEITEAEDGQKAYDLFRASPDAYDLIFMDIHMPGVDGYESTRRIRAFNHPKAKTIPIIAMTANVFREDIERCHAAGMNGHIGKPLDFNAVIAILKQYLL